MIKLFLLFLFNFYSGEVSAIGKIDSVGAYIQNAGAPSDYAVLIDMSIPSNEKRLFLVQIRTRKIMYSTYVAHGKGSGMGSKATYFSDKPGGLCTTLGHFKVGKKYFGEHGEAFELIGLEKTNANAVKRSIVIHAAWYATQKFIEQY